MQNMFSFLLEATTNPGGNSWMTIVMLVLVVVVFYFFLIRPQKKQEKEAANMRNSIEVGDEIVTIGGIIGQVINVKNDTITIVTGKDRVKIRFLKTAIREVTVKANEPEENEAPSASAIEPAKEKTDDVVEETKTEETKTEETNE